MDKIIEKAILLKQKLEELKEEQQLIEGQLYDMHKEMEPKPKYGNVEVIVNPNYKDSCEKFEGEAVRIITYLLNEKEKKEHMNIFGRISGDWKERRISVSYFRNEYGVLNHSGGGWILLKDGIPCTDEEWELIKQGSFPEKFETKNLI